jgi:hypothetical protein
MDADMEDLAVAVEKAIHQVKEARDKSYFGLAKKGFPDNESNIKTCFCYLKNVKIHDFYFFGQGRRNRQNAMQRKV